MRSRRVCMDKQVIDHEWTSFPVCPYCGESDQDWWDGLETKNDGDEWDSECGACGQSYKISMSVSVDFCTFKESK